ncbi:SH3 domain-containing protein [Exiguobacterium flavidum]|uniref:SH3 domain-containing protein n=1 Tax=Exiguobacterium flavidum TaxID=2184695 RepID=UPI000DF80560|nr:SH3 domain-containing protein [Exiguobacterium flavidum]
MSTIQKMMRIGMALTFAMAVLWTPVEKTFAAGAKEGYSITAQKVYASASTKSKTVGSLKKNQTVSIYVNKGSWSQIKYGKTKGWVAKTKLKLGKPVIAIDKGAYATSTQYVYTSQSTKSKRLVKVNKNQNVYVLSSQSGWYRVLSGGKNGWVVAKHFKIGTYVSKPAAGKPYPDGWTAPVLKSSWNSDHEKNLQTLQNELGFRDGGHVYTLPEYPQGAIHVWQEDKIVALSFYFWQDVALPSSYRVPIVAKELFKLYFGSDAMKVWNYFNRGDVPESFTANRFKVKASYNPMTGSLTLWLR